MNRFSLRIVRLVQPNFLNGFCQSASQSLNEMFIFLLLSVFFLSANSLDVDIYGPTKLKNRWFGSSYRPTWLDSKSYLVRNSHWTYSGPNGPDEWHTEFPECGGRRQSPIDVDTTNLEKVKTKTPLKWSNYDTVGTEYTLENSGHSLHLTGVWKEPGQIPYITGGVLENKYYFSQLHFHWGVNSFLGSEHTVNGESFPLEMHVVHDRRVEIEPTNPSEEGNSDSLVVVTYMFEVVKNDNPNLKPILDASAYVREPATNTTKVILFPLENLVDPFGGDYASYKGSLTTPPCTEGVIWIINSKALGISERQLNILRRSILNVKGRPENNHRPVQNLNGRKIYYVFC